MDSTELNPTNDCHNCSSEGAENDVTQQAALDSHLEAPKTGMLFQSEEEAYNFYNAYARKNGFSVRKDRLHRRPDGSVYSRKIVCSYAGVRAKHRGHVTHNPHVNQRTGCKCRIDLRASKDGVWEIYHAFNEHNHHLVSPNKTFMLRSHRKILPSTLNIIEQMDKAGIPPSKAFEFFKEGSTSSQNVGFLRIDHNNSLLGLRHKSFNRNDAQSLLDHFKRKQLTDPAFYYAIQLSDAGHIANIFWADGKSLVDYAFFGDVICFDTTFKTNKYDLPFAPLLGVNNHKQTVVFGAALLNDESTESFIWLFETFMNVVARKHPKTIFTDRCAAMAKAISTVFPTTAHRLCLWHIFENAAKHLSSIFAEHASFSTDFRRCIYEARSFELLDFAWQKMLNAYQLETNEWLMQLWELREKWSAFYRGESFCANMTTTQRSESMNNYFKKHLGRKLSFIRFMEEYEIALCKFREKELYEDHKSRNFMPVIRVANLQMLKDGAKAYTRAIYSDFEGECLNQLSCICELMSVDRESHMYKVSPPEDFKTAIVTFDSKDSTVSCSCKKLESVGILCMHAMKVLTHNIIMSLSPLYILKRWTKYAKDGLPYSSAALEYAGINHQYTRVSTNAMALVKKGAASKKALELLEQEIDNLSIQVDGILSCELPSENTTAMSLQEPCISIKPPPTKSTGQRRRFKSALERITKKKKKSCGPETATISTPSCSEHHDDHMLTNYGFMGLLSQVSQESQTSRRLF